MTQLKLPAGVQITAPLHPRFDEILTPDALALVAKLHRAFESRRRELLHARVTRQIRIDAGEMPDFLPETRHIREGTWRVAPLPKALECRRVEITGPVERKMIINAFNSGADSYMADFEDSNSPKWFNQIQGQVNLKDAIRRTISLEQGGKVYRLNDKIATLQIRPRGWHLDGAFSISPWSSSITPRSRSPAAPAPSTTCRRWNPTSRRGCGTISSSRPRMKSAFPRAPSRRQC